MVAPNFRRLRAFPLHKTSRVQRTTKVPGRMVRAAADRGALSQLEAWLDFCENRDRLERGKFPGHTN